MQIRIIRNITLRNIIFALIFVILISCDTTGNSNEENAESMPTPSPSPTMMPTPPPLLPPQTPLPTQQPTSPVPTTAPPTPAPSSPPSAPTPTPRPTQAPPTPTPAPTPTPQPTATPSPTNPPGGPLNQFQSEVLDLVNDARSQGRNCGSEFFPAAPPVIWDERVEDAAQIHTEDMALNENFSHTALTVQMPGTDF